MSRARWAWAAVWLAAPWAGAACGSNTERGVPSANPPAEAASAPSASASAVETDAEPSASASGSASGSSSALGPPKPGPDSWERALGKYAGREPRLRAVKPTVAKPPWPECASLLAQERQAARHEAAFTAAKAAADAKTKADRDEAYAAYAPRYRAWYDRRVTAVDAVAVGCSLAAGGTGTSPVCQELSTHFTETQASRPFVCEPLVVLEKPDTDLLLCSVPGWGANVMVELPKDRAALVEPALAADSLASALGAKTVASTDESAPSSPSGTAIEVTPNGALRRFATYDGFVSRQLEALVTLGWPRPVAASLLGNHSLWMLSSLAPLAGAPVIKKHEPKEAPAEPDKPAEPEPGPSRWVTALEQVEKDDRAHMDSWTPLLPPRNARRLVSFPAAGSPAEALLVKHLDLPGMVSFRRSVKTAGGFAPIACRLKDVTLAPFRDPERASIATLAGVTQVASAATPGGLETWELTCKGDEATSFGTIVVEVPSHLVWAKVATSYKGFSALSYHAELGGLFEGDLRPIAEKGLVDLAAGSELTITGYTHIRHQDGSFRVRFTPSCRDEGLPCTHREGLAPSIAATKLVTCPVSSVVYP